MKVAIRQKFRIICLDPDRIVLTLCGKSGNIAKKLYNKRNYANKKGKRISSEAVAMLRKRKLIEGRLPHIFIAKDIAQVTDQKIEYSKHKGLDDKKCEALLLDSLKDHGSLTKPEIVRLLWDVLPDQLDDRQKNNKLDYLLKRLRKAGKIWTERNEVTSVWHLTEK